MAKEKTLGIKTTEEKFTQWLEVFKGSGFSNYEEWMDSLLSEKDLEALQENNKEYTQEITELKVHTTRINELVSNMVRRAVYLKDDAVRELQTKLDSKDSIILGLQNDVKLLKDSAAASNEVAEKLTVDNEELKTKIVEAEKKLNETINNAERDKNDKQALIDEWKEKNENLASLVAKYQKYADENEKIKEEFGTKEERLLSQIQELKQSLQDQQEQNERLENEMALATRNHKTEIDKIKNDNETVIQRLNTEHVAAINQKDVEKQQALLELEKGNQAEIAGIRDEYNNRITELYDRLDHRNTEDKKK